MHYSWQLVNRLLSVAAVGACLSGPLGPGTAAAGDLDPPSPAAFMPGGMLGIQIGAPWAESKKNKSLEHLSCQTVEPKGEVDEVCFFNPSAASRVGGAEIHDGFIVRKDDRVVLKFPPMLAPIKLAILPLTKKDGLPELAKDLMKECMPHFRAFYEEKDAIGKRYRRQDAIGTPFCVTIDYQTKKDGTVTIRYRDSMEQERIPMADVKKLVLEKTAMF